MTLDKLDKIVTTTDLSAGAHNINIEAQKTRKSW